MNENKNWGSILIALAIVLAVGFIASSCSHVKPLWKCNGEPTVSHSCPKKGHGPCYLCDENKYKIIYGRKDILNN